MGVTKTLILRGYLREILTINGGTPSVGRSAIAEAAQGFMTAFPDLKVYMDDLLEKQGKVIPQSVLLQASQVIQ